MTMYMLVLDVGPELMDVSEPWSFVIALAPIFFVIVALLSKVPSLWASLIGLSAAIIGTVTVFPVSSHTVSSTTAVMGGTFITVALILLGGVGLAEVTARSGAQTVIAKWLLSAGSGQERLTLILLIGFGVTPFMESVTGFGLGVVISAPLLIHLGLTPFRAVTTGLLGLTLVPWGSLAPGTLVAADLGGVSFHALGVWSALLTLPVLIASVIAIVLLNQLRPTLRQWSFVSVVVLVEWLVLIAANVLAGPPLAGVLGSAAVIVVVMLRMRRSSGAFPVAPAGLARALLPYSVLVGGLLTATAVIETTDLRELAVATNPALWLIIAVITTIVVQRRSGVLMPKLISATFHRWLPVAAITLLFMLLGTVMSANGMAAQLAATAASQGSIFLVFVPIIGALGGYLTGSNTGSAAMFSTATTSAVAHVGASPLIALAAQNVAGSVAMIASPSRMAFAAAVALEPREKLPASAHRTLLATVGATVILLAICLPLL